MTDPFSPKASADVARLIHAHPLAWVVARDFQASPLPLLVETGADGQICALLGHMGRSNALHGSLTADPRALVLFSGPDAYVSPRLVSNRAWGPTWNYAVVRFEVEVEFRPGETGEAVAKLVAHMEAGHEGAWSVPELGSRYQDLLARIIAFRAHIRGGSARFKLGQDESARVFGEIVQGMAGTPLAAWMTSQRREGD